MIFVFSSPYTSHFMNKKDFGECVFIFIMSAERHGLVEIESQIYFVGGLATEGIGSEPQPFSKIAP